MTARAASAAGDHRWRLVALGLGLLLLQLLALALHDRWDADYAFVAAVLAGSGLYLLAARIVTRVAPRPGALAIVVGVALVLRLVLLAEPPLHSTDAYRYVWDGRVQAAGINPYRFVPADPALEPLRDEAVYPRINRADYAVTIYPPVAQMAFLLFHMVGDSLIALKLGLLALEALAMWALVRLLVAVGRPPEQLLLYAWHPLPIWEIAGDAHLDGGMMALLVFALWAARSRGPFTTGALLAGSVLFKPLTVAALPAFWRPWEWRAPLAFVLVVVLAYLPYLGVGSGVLGFLGTYAAEEGISNGGGFFLLALLGRLFGSLPPYANPAYLAASGLVLGGLALAVVRDPRSDPATMARHAQWLLLAFLLLLSPNYPWYFLVLVPLGCLSFWPPAMALTLTAPVLYAAPPINANPQTFAVHAALYAVVLVAFAVALYQRRSRADHTPQPRSESQPP